VSSVQNAILTLNAGSSSIKFGVFACDAAGVSDEKPVLQGQVDGLGAAGQAPQLHARDRHSAAPLRIELAAGTTGLVTHAEALAAVLDWIASHNTGLRLIGVGHRVVHGGQEFSSPVRITPEIRAALGALTPLAPLHQPHNLAGIDAVAHSLPALPQVACFDTAFHRSQPELAQLFALPRHLTDSGIRRYGFHGLSYEYIAQRLPSVLGSDRAEGRVIVAHLGNGASMCALRGRRSQATTMGFTAIDGLMMGTRPGALDPGVLLHLIEHEAYDAAALTRLLYRESGLLGVSGLSADMRSLLESDSADAKLAVDLFCYRAVREIGALAACLGGLDALVITGGIGEHAAIIRARIVDALDWLGLSLDTDANAVAARLISTPVSRVVVAMIPTNEEWMIARHTQALVA
jgi:acetate kinase